MVYLGDIRVGEVIRGAFNTRDTAQAPITLAGTPALRVYKDANDGESSSGITLTVDQDGVTGRHRWTVDTSTDGTFYSAGSNFFVVISTGTVNAISVVGTVVGFFSIENRSALMPTTAGRKLDVTATGAGGIDWANVENPTTALDLTQTKVKTATDVETDTADIQTRLPAALVSGRMSSDAVAISGSTAAADNVEANIPNLDATVSSRLPTSGYVAPDNATIVSIGSRIPGALTGDGNIKADALKANGAAIPTNFNLLVIDADGRIDLSKVLGTTINALISGRIDANAQVVGTAAISSTSFGASSIDAAALATDAVTEIVAAVFARAFAAGYGSFTFDQMIKIIVAALAGVTSSMDSPTGTIRNLANLADVIVASLDGNGNRTAVTLTP